MGATAATAQDRANDAHQSVIRIYTNMYWVHIWVIELCAAMVLRSPDVEWKLDLARDMAKARDFALLFRDRLIDSGVAWDEIDHEALTFSIIEQRYADLRENAAELDFIVGVQMFAHGVLGCTEYTELYRNSPELFPEVFQEIAEHKKQAAGRARQRLTQMIDRDPHLRPIAAALARKHAESLGQTAADPDYGQFLQRLIAQGLLTTDVVARAGERFTEVFGWLLDEPESSTGQETDGVTA